MTKQAQPSKNSRVSRAGAEFAQLRFAADFGDMELLTARYFAHQFAPHVHDSDVIAPGEVHTGQRGCEHGWAYRALYPAPVSWRA